MLSGLNNTNLICYHSEGQKSKVYLTGLKPRCQQALFFSGGSKVKSVFLLFWTWRDFLYSLASSIFQVSNGWSVISHYTCSLFECEFLLPSFGGFLGGSDGQESACNAGYTGLVPGLGRFPGEGNGNPLQYSCLENSMDRGAWWATVHGVAKSRTWLSD